MWTLWSGGNTWTVRLEAGREQIRGLCGGPQGPDWEPAMQFSWHQASSHGNRTFLKGPGIPFPSLT